MTTFYWVLGAIALIGVGFLIVYALRSSQGGVAGGSTTAPAEEIIAFDAPVGMIGAGLAYTNEQGQQINVPAGMYYKGNPDAPVKVIAYEDFQCPGCANFSTQLEAGLTEKYVESGQVQFIFHDFPLSQHANAPIAAEAARCAGTQNKFWPMHDLLFSRQAQWESDGRAADRFITYAAELGLDRNAFQACLNDGKEAPKVTEAGITAQNAGIPATPTFVVNGKQVPTNGLNAAIDAALRGQ
jgi:protein-disulfide isomerase